MKSFTISAAVLAAGVSAQYSAAVPSMGASSPAASMMPSYAASMPPASMPAASMPAPSVTTTITAKAGCPTGPAPDVMVTRSNVPVPSCAAGSNATKPSIVSMPGYGPPPAGASGTGSGSGSGAGGMGNATMTGMPPQFTGAAGKTAVSGVLAVVAGLAAWAL